VIQPAVTIGGKQLVARNKQKKKKPKRRNDALQYVLMVQDARFFPPWAEKISGKKLRSAKSVAERS
jgi:hypothetical protein